MRLSEKLRYNERMELKAAGSYIYGTVVVLHIFWKKIADRAMIFSHWGVSVVSANPLRGLLDAVIGCFMRRQESTRQAHFYLQPHHLHRYSHVLSRTFYLFFYGTNQPRCNKWRVPMAEVRFFILFMYQIYE